jgi:hypothetical protein
MAKGTKTKAKVVAKGSEPGGAEFRPGEFEEIELPGEAPHEDASEFQEIDLEMVSLGVKRPSQEMRAAKEQLEQQLVLGVTQEALSAESGTDSHGFENIVGVGLSEKMVGDEYTDEPCVTVYVVAKVPKGEVAAEAVVPEEVNGVPTDVVATGELHAFPHRGRYRPAPGGVSVGHFRITAGTIGCLVRRGTALFILSNNHVLANVNQAHLGDPILQPGPFDGGRIPADVIAKLSKFIPINFGAPNTVDCAIAQTSPSLVTPLNKCFGRIRPVPVPCRLNLLVKKCGRTTQFTRGRITDCSATVRVGYGTSGVAVFQNQIIMTSLTSSPFSAGGDSGSLIVTDEGNQPVGLLFAGSSTHTIANHIQDVLSALGVTIVA